MRKILLIAVLLVAGSASVAGGAPIVAVDYGGSGTAPTGWTAWTFGEHYGAWALLSKTVGSYTVKTGSVSDMSIYANSNDASAPPVSLGEMYRDGLTRSSWGGGYFEIQVLGLAGNTEHTLDVWHWSGGSSSSTWYDRTSGSDVAISITAGDGLGGSVMSSSAAAPDDDADYWSQFKVTSDASGTIVLRATGNAGYRINGFAVSEPAPVPEPATLLLVGTGALGMIGALRRRMMK